MYDKNKHRTIGQFYEESQHSLSTILFKDYVLLSVSNYKFQCFFSAITYSIFDTPEYNYELRYLVIYGILALDLTKYFANKYLETEEDFQ